MAAKEVAKDKIIASEGQALDAVHIIVSGSVNAHFDGGDITLRKGDIVGLCDIAFDSHFFTYTTLETSSFVSFPFKGAATLANIVKVNPEVAKMMFTSINNQIFLIFATYLKSKEKCDSLYKKIKSLYDEYLDFCSHNNVISRSLPIIEDINPLSLEENEIADWMFTYYSSVKDFPQELKHSLAARVPFLIGYLIKASTDIHSAFSACSAMGEYVNENGIAFMQESRLDLFDIYSSLLFRLKPGTPDADAVSKQIEDIIGTAESLGCVDKNLFEMRVSEYRGKSTGISSQATTEDEHKEPVNLSAEIMGAVDTILEYAGMDIEQSNNFKSLLAKYKKLTDKASSEDGPRKLRLELTKAFYKIYVAAFKASIRDFSIPVVLKMFFNFGFIDPELLSPENVEFLYNLASEFRGDEDKCVYTAYEWLMAIYKLKKEPSRNEFDTDFLSYLHEQKVAGKITAKEEQELSNDPWERVMFELNNMFPMVNKVTYGRLTSFCPILSEHDVIKPLQTCLVNVESVTESFKKLEEIDYGAFYRETVFSNEASGIQKEFISVKIMPDVILFPNIGTRGVMWQEIEGKKRTTHARFMVSVFHLEDLPTTLTRLTGEYRWEMCKRVQGARWNDVSDRSLTSEYFDYVQFYKKNSELSSDAKEKIKNSLAKAKNSFKEMFVRDYITWILFEGTGSPRLNKVARSIFCTYCPFPKELRTKIGANPMFKDLIERYEIKTSQKIHHFENVITKLKSCNQEIPPELIEHRDFIEGTL